MPDPWDKDQILGPYVVVVHGLYSRRIYRLDSRNPDLATTTLGNFFLNKGEWSVVQYASLIRGSGLLCYVWANQYAPPGIWSEVAAENTIHRISMVCNYFHIWKFLSYC